MTNIKESPLKTVSKFGQSIWYDGFVAVREFRRMIEEDGLRGATTNPTIFEKAISAGELDAELSAAFASGADDDETYQTIAVKAVREICDVFSPVFRASAGRDGFVSIEVSPLLAHDTERTLREARELHRRVGRPNVMIKIPATKAGIPAIETAIAEGIHVNVTLIFSVERYREVMDAYLGGLERRSAAGHSVRAAASVASFFVSRVDTAVDKLLEAKIAVASGDEKEKLSGLRGKAAIANSKVAYEAFEKVFSSPRFEKLKTAGAHAQRPLWASTGTKNPAYSDVLYVEALIGPDTVDTVPPATLAAYRDHGSPAARLKTGVAEAHEFLKRLAETRIDLERVTEELETAGVGLFSDSYKKIIAEIRAKRQAIGARPR